MFGRLVDAVFGLRRERSQKAAELDRLEVETDGLISRADRALVERERLVTSIRNVGTSLQRRRR